MSTYMFLWKNKKNIYMIILVSIAMSTFVSGISVGGWAG